MANLYQLGDELNAIVHQVQSLLDDGADPSSDEVQFLLEKMVNAEGDWKAKAVRVGLYIRQCLAEADMVKAEAKRLNDRATKHTKQADYLSDLLKSQMLALGEMEIEDPLCPIKLKENPWSVAVENPDLLPDQYKRLKVEADKRALLKDRETLKGIGGIVFDRAIAIRIG